MTARLDFDREQILRHRRTAGELERRLSPGADSLRRAAWLGLQDSMPRAALLSIHARVADATPSSWEDSSLVQVWGPRYGAYVIAAVDLPIFTLGRLPTDAKGRKRAEQLADLLHDKLAGRRIPYGQAGHELGFHGNRLRYAAQTGRVVIRWEGARQPTVWTVPPPEITPVEARLELARRYLHVLGPTTAGAFAKWAGIGAGDGRSAFAALADELTPVRTPIGDAWILASDEPSFAAKPGSEPGAIVGMPGRPTVRLLPSGDAYWLLYGADRELLVPDAKRRSELWTPRVWPGALLVDGDIAGTWRRADADVSVDAWRALSEAEREAVEAEARSLPLPNLVTPIRVTWSS
ncbi:MAG: crosslink repair DNA glycosylase YcaQ family protein [Chloroflexota bacterium]